ncbi:hypothetical protein [Duganella vulcania]|uniref:Transporter n=1 Tax=Duganella vulcania TaxID=2692166 RepID=A0A845GIF0_9BURK|nr:hypothetical protein [Duganella vulcania]MYM93202.1 hypothetical protein [Duganella vulcania]
MELKYYLYCFADLVLIATSLIYGIKFLKKGNILLGGELLVVTFSATNLLVNALTEIPMYMNVSLFCDAFSRSFGIPVIGIAGLMAATHRFKPSTFVDVLLFALGLVVTVVVWAGDFMKEPKPYLYLALWSAFSLFLVYFAVRLVRAGEKVQALGVILAMAFAQAIASIYDFYHIPGDDDHVIFYTFALLAWSLLGVAMYHAYCALERTQSRPQTLS